MRGNGLENLGNVRIEPGTLAALRLRGLAWLLGFGCKELPKRLFGNDPARPIPKRSIDRSKPPEFAKLANLRGGYPGKAVNLFGGVEL